MAVKWSLTWYGDAVAARLNERLHAGVEAAALAVLQYARQSVSRPNPTGRAPSRPGEPPKMVTGELRDSLGAAVAVEGERVVAVVGAGARHALFLELGTRRMAARPFLRPALFNQRGEILRLVAGGR